MAFNLKTEEEQVNRSALLIPGLSEEAFARSLLVALVYSDLFDYPLTLNELFRYQAASRFREDEIGAALASMCVPGALIAERDGYYFLRGRDYLVELRRQRAARSEKVWRRAKLYSSWIARLPFVRMVAVTGALSVDNIADKPDIDLLVVATPGRVWMCRRLLIALVRLARLAGDELCPNYILSKDKLTLEQRDFFTAHELAQMVLIWGAPLYERMISCNAWAAELLPEAFPAARRATLPHPTGPITRMVERVLSLNLLDGWERWELARLQAKLRPQIGDEAEIVCSLDQCKGHTARHRSLAISRFRKRLAELGLDPHKVGLPDSATL